MTLSVLVFFSRALRVQARSVFTYVIRGALVAVLLLYLLSAFGMRGRLGAPGLRLFESIVWVNWAFITLAGFSYFSSAITEEKAEMMLGLLKMTGLNAVSVLLGKSTSRLLGALLILLGQVPLSLLSITLGGLAWNQFAAAYLALAAYLILVSNLALFSSVVSRNSSAAGLMTFAFAGIMLSMPGICGNLPSGPNAGAAAAVMGSVGAALSQASILRRLPEVMATGYAGPLVDLQFYLDAAGGLGFFLLAWSLFEFATREQRPEGAARGLVPRRTRWLGVMAPGRVWKNALAWKDFHFVAGGVPFILAKTALYALILAGLAVFIWKTGNRGFDYDAWAVSALWAMVICTCIELAGFACRVFSAEKAGKTLSGLATLPVGMGTVAWRKTLGCAAALLPNVLLLGIMAVLARNAVMEALVGMMDEPEGGAVLCTGMTIGLLFILTASTLSLALRHGALIVSLVIFLVLGSCVGVPLGFLFSLARVLPLQLGVAAGLSVVAFLVFGRMIVAQLERAAGAE